MGQGQSDFTKEKLEDLLKRKNLRVTAERLTILDEALATEGHFEADDLLAILKTKGIKTSRATIYRTLELLCELGFLRKVCFREAHLHFQKVTDKPRRDHLICTRCGAQLDFHLPQLNQIQMKLCEENGFKMTDYCFHIFGLCSKCSAALS
jgi:Fur family transcriptional regulator, ferric uptake regulator